MTETAAEKIAEEFSLMCVPLCVKDMASVNRVVAKETDVLEARIEELEKED